MRARWSGRRGCARQAPTSTRAATASSGTIASRRSSSADSPSRACWRLISQTDSRSGVLAVDKPEGWTSHDVVALVRGVLGTRRVGHGGTLDPQATGLLPVLVGSATKFADRIHEATKVYDALVRFGSDTATDDREGAVTRESGAPALVMAAIEPALATLRGVIAQVPPQFSALKVSGRPAYARARRGETVALAARTVQVLRLDVIEIDPPELRLYVVCSSGTYVP